MEPRQPRKSVHVFTLQLWPEDGEDDRPTWSGRLYDVAENEVHYYQGWTALVPLLRSVLQEAGSGDAELNRGEA